MASWDLSRALTAGATGISMADAEESAAVEQPAKTAVENPASRKKFLRVCCAFILFS